MSEQDRNLAQMGDDQYLRHHRAQEQIQQAIQQVLPGASDLTKDEIVARLSAALAERGIGPQPRNWLDAVASEAQRGRLYVEEEGLGRPAPE
ncbi:hypothetical protein [Pedococcus sp. 5OH_020]|jgi:hypothetical protein|uniref:hypothetical protein n=1 Tax=Pedococcus sp. 5OH_020 TaxID=2989814 RepID=UPI0022E9B6B7|nr:hypothetical protein [Pedococcus sp. 5OH_020]